MGVEGITPVRFAEQLLKQNIVLPHPQRAANSFWMTGFSKSKKGQA